MRERLVQLGRKTLESLPRRPRNFGIQGAVGDALFACALNRLDRSIDTTYWISRALDHFNEHGSDASLHRGMAGLGFVLATYSDASDILLDVDEALRRHLSPLPPASIQSGLAGIALYASLRSNTKTGRRLQQAVIGALAALAEPSAGGLIWYTPTQYARSRGVDVLGEPVTEFGILHGISGVLVALASLAKEGHQDAGDLARGGIRALWAWERPGANRFGRIHFGPHGLHGVRDFDDGSWCVGDSGVLRACWLAATAIGDATSADRALALLREGAEKALTGAMPGTPGRFDLCCGSGVIAQVYLRMHATSGEHVFRAANERILATCAQAVEHLEESSFAYGRMGVILALLSAVTEEDPTWDAMLGISLSRTDQNVG